MANSKDDCEALLNFALPFAERFLAETGEFYPFGAILEPEGRMTSYAGYDGREYPPSEALMTIIVDGLIEGARNGSYKATALVYDVRISDPVTGEKNDAIAVALDHRDNYSMVLYFIYVIEKGQVSIQAPTASPGTGRVFG